MQRSASFRFDCLWTGGFYLGLAITGGLAFLMVRPQLFVIGDPAGTLANLASRPDLARAGIALELATAALQALAAVWFTRLFRDTDAFAAGALALFGMVNAFVMLASATFLAVFRCRAGKPGKHINGRRSIFSAQAPRWRAWSVEGCLACGEPASGRPIVTTTTEDPPTSVPGGAISLRTRRYRVKSLQ